MVIFLDLWDVHLGAIFCWLLETQKWPENCCETKAWVWKPFLKSTDLGDLWVIREPFGDTYSHDYLSKNCTLIGPDMFDKVELSTLNSETCFETLEKLELEHQVLEHSQIKTRPFWRAWATARPQSHAVSLLHHPLGCLIAAYCCTLPTSPPICWVPLTTKFQDFGISFPPFQPILFQEIYCMCSILSQGFLPSVLLPYFFLLSSAQAWPKCLNAKAALNQLDEVRPRRRRRAQQRGAGAGGPGAARGQEAPEHGVAKATS